MKHIKCIIQYHPEFKCHVCGIVNEGEKRTYSINHNSMKSIAKEIEKLDGVNNSSAYFQPTGWTSSYAREGTVFTCGYCK